ncbi:cytochrome c5 family protein [Massilia sp. Leaf139]|uniref:c-type cytochrome n=1 Tax=Massilia sp. Leaf139 TaxID=1736272 RepID=UPI0006F51096|nr:c-type cytochrome [Massilia sp. Leaf139]KQQ88326.1 cytochrome C [Massilia sp. Leaf139]
MSDAHNEQSFIRTPKQLIGVVAGFFLVIVIGIILLVSFVTNDKLEGAGTNSLGPEAVAQRLRPVAEEGFILRDANAPKVLQAGGAVYTAVCAACHASGAAGAPKTGVAGDWTARLAQGYDTLVKHAIEGIRAMPAKGGNPDLDNVEVERAVVYMANQSGAKFKEPAVPAPAAPVAAAAAAAGTETAAAPVAANAATAAPVAGTPASAAPAAAPAAATTPAPAAAPAAAPAVANADAGKALYNSACIACHGAGIAGAPKLADKANWAPRIKQGNAVLYEHAIKGFQGKAGVMPPKGGSTAPDADVKAAVDFMVASAR